jgi:hypothetical protein
VDNAVDCDIDGVLSDEDDDDDPDDPVVKSKGKPGKSKYQ